MSSKKRTNGFVILSIVLGIVALFGILTFGNFKVLNNNSKYYEILGYYQKDEVLKSTLEFSSGNLHYVLKKDRDRTHVYKVPSVVVFFKSVNEIVCKNNNSDLSNAKDTINYVRGRDFSWILSLAPSVLGILIMIMWFLFILKFPGSGVGRLGQFGRGGFKKSDPNGSNKTTFADVAGADEEKAELADVIDFLKNPKKFIDMGARIPKGVLLIGPPGTGKTLLARAVAGEANVSFFTIAASAFVELYVGMGASRVRDLFEQAKKEAPSIIFIDEIDAVGRHRGAGLGGGHDEREQTLNQLLVEMDGFSANEGLVVIAATNRSDILDPALLRPGRFDRRVNFVYPDVKGREDILKVHSKGKSIGFDVDWSVVARSTVGLTGADLANLINESALLAVKKGHKAITLADIEEAFIKVIMGPEKRSRVLHDDERKLTAYHEAGHAVATHFCPSQDAVYSISIIPRGYAGGYTMSLPERDIDYVLKNKMEESLVVALGGRVAESLILDDVSTGAYSDIKYVTATARDMVKTYGFTDSLGPIIYGSGEKEVFLGLVSNTPNYSESTANKIDQEVKRIVDEAYEKCRKILSDNLKFVHIVAAYLLKKEKMDGKEFEDVMSGKITMEDVKNMEEARLLGVKKSSGFCEEDGKGTKDSDSDKDV